MSWLGEGTYVDWRDEEEWLPMVLGDVERWSRSTRDSPVRSIGRIAGTFSVDVRKVIDADERRSNNYH